jgi:glycosyltransferase involved in cell wall biosynthesis
MFSIIIPTFNNLEYLQLCLDSIEKNSKFKHEIIIHVNEGTDGTLDYVIKKKLKHTYTKKNVGLCTATNLASLNASTDYILYSHDDMYFCPDWDVALNNEINELNTCAYYISGTMIERTGGHIQIDCGSDQKNFDENKLLKNFNKREYFNHQGTHWAPHLIHRSFWKKIGGFSEEFNPGIGSDPDLNMKLWKSGVRIFKGLSKFRVYHFGSIVLRKKINFKKNNGTKTFLIKWGFTPTFFVKYYLRGGFFEKGIIKCKEFDGPLKEPVKDIFYFTNLLICKVKLIYLKIFRF